MMRMVVYDRKWIPFLLLVLLECIPSTSSSVDGGNMHYIQPSDLSDIVYHSCVLVSVPPREPNTEKILENISHVFRNDRHVLVGLFVNIDNRSQVRWKQEDEPGPLAFYPRERLPRSCLLAPRKQEFLAEIYKGQLNLEKLVQFLNEKCGTFRTIHGDLNSAGLYHQHLQQNLYVPNKPVSQCTRVQMPEQMEFFQEYLLRSKPVVIENAISNWPAMRKWTIEYLRRELGSREVHLKLTPDSIFEGVESASLWSGYHKDWIPPKVKSQLRYPDLVVVRPATTEMKFASFLDLISSGNMSYSAYLEYSSIPQYMPKLLSDIAELPIVKDVLDLRHLNMWLSDGNTLGKLHFDPYDNFLCQVSGEKHLILFDPHHNENLYEAHIPEAILTFDHTKNKFYRRTLLESTSMVMSPVDILDPDQDRFPLFARANRLECRLRAGDALFMPAFWWHEVQSHPDKQKHHNMAVNFWYEPVYVKEFPCAECRVEFNMAYRRLLDG